MQMHWLKGMVALIAAMLLITMALAKNPTVSFLPELPHIQSAPDWETPPGFPASTEFASEDDSLSAELPAAFSLTGTPTHSLGAMVRPPENIGGEFPQRLERPPQIAHLQEKVKPLF